MKRLSRFISGFKAIRGRRIRLAVVVLAALGVACLVQMPAVSAGAGPTSGTVGRYTILNHPDGSYADCFYQPFVSAQYPNGRRLARIEVRAPIMYAVDRTAAEDTQQVTYTATLTRRDSNGTISVVQRGPIHQRTATDRNPASFPASSFDMSGRPEGTYVIQFDMSWRRPSNPSDSEGNAQYVFDYYDQFRLVSGGANVREWYQATGCIKTFTW